MDMFKEENIKGENIDNQLKSIESLENETVDIELIAKQALIAMQMINKDRKMHNVLSFSKDINRSMKNRS